MNAKNIWKPILVILIAAVLITTFSLVRNPRTQSGAPVTFTLKAPLFVSEARAETGSIASFMEDEAGISCYYQASSSITIDNVRDTYRTIEVEKSDYIIGSVAVSDYPESEDVHVYVHTDGWVVAYYLAADPVGKIFDWHDYDGTSVPTKLENTIAIIANAAGVAYTSCTYYDFRYPNATKMMLIAEEAGTAGDSFEINLPGTFVIDERSWSLGSGGYWSYLHLDDINRIAECDRNDTCAGTFTAVQLEPDEFHTFTVESAYGICYGGLALVYREDS